jgi:glycosyltransferase involved in cell wall biosynthesis
MVHPARYEAYGLGVHEAICRGVPAIVSAQAGIAELYPPELSDLLIPDVEDATGIADRLLAWRRGIDSMAARLGPLSDRLRSRSWDDMGKDIVRAVTA